MVDARGATWGAWRPRTKASVAAALRTPSSTARPPVRSPSSRPRDDSSLTGGPRWTTRSAPTVISTSEASSPPLFRTISPPSGRRRTGSTSSMGATPAAGGAARRATAHAGTRCGSGPVAAPPRPWSPPPRTGGVRAGAAAVSPARKGDSVADGSASERCRRRPRHRRCRVARSGDRVPSMSSMETRSRADDMVWGGLARGGRGADAFD